MDAELREQERLLKQDLRQHERKHLSDQKRQQREAQELTVVKQFADQTGMTVEQVLKMREAQKQLTGTSAKAPAKPAATAVDQELIEEGKRLGKLRKQLERDDAKYQKYARDVLQPLADALGLSVEQVYQFKAAEAASKNKRVPAPVDFSELEAQEAALAARREQVAGQAAPQADSSAFDTAAKAWAAQQSQAQQGDDMDLTALANQALLKKLAENPALADMLLAALNG